MSVDTNTITNIMVVGMGGQGIMTAAELLSETALDQGYDVKKTEVAGMSQRGGVVTSHVRFGKKVLSPVISEGDIDVLLCFEKAEALRWHHWLKEGGVILVNDLKFEPPVVSLGLYDYPDDPFAQMKAKGLNLSYFDATEIALKLGNIKLVNTVMLGAISRFLPFSAEILRKKIVDRFTIRKPKLASLNADAFDLGQQASR